MPRRNRSARDRSLPVRRPAIGGVPPPDTHVAGYTVRQVSQGQKEYLCPGCNQTISAGVAHLVVWQDEEPDLRRHWHTPCWRREKKLLR